MKYWKHIASFLAALTITGVTFGVAHLPPSHVGPDYLYPDSKLTPGLVATTDFKELTQTNPTYSQAHRKTTEAMKKQVCDEYPCQGLVIEIDHFCPLALGCADDARNLWAQPETNLWNGTDYGFHTKDRLEAYLVLQMKAGNISPKDAQDCILSDWVRCYTKYIAARPSFGGIQNGDNSVDPDEDAVQ